MNTKIESAKYIAAIENVKETILFGTADLDYWRVRLKSENLFPLSANGKAQIMIGGTQFVWSGIPTRELVISLSISLRADANTADAAYLIHAFNSSRILAFAERAFFQTPYDWGKVEISERVPAFINFADGDGAMFRAQMGGAHLRLRGEDQMLEGAIYLPQSNNVFSARLGGYTETYSVVAGVDRIEMRSSPRAPVFEWLAESQFTPQEWRLRTNATHARSKTYKRI